MSDKDILKIIASALLENTKAIQNLTCLGVEVIEEEEPIIGQEPLAKERQEYKDSLGYADPRGGEGVQVQCGVSEEFWKELGDPHGKYKNCFNCKYHGSVNIDVSNECSQCGYYYGHKPDEAVSEEN